jgi:hypothetical protein
MGILDDPEREFAAGAFLRLEVLPQAVFLDADYGLADGLHGGEVPLGHHVTQP